jgi:hypothetical protein
VLGLRRSLLALPRPSRKPLTAEGSEPGSALSMKAPSADRTERVVRSGCGPYVLAANHHGGAQSVGEEGLPLGGVEVGRERRQGLGLGMPSPMRFDAKRCTLPGSCILHYSYSTTCVHLAARTRLLDAVMR